MLQSKSSLLAIILFTIAIPLYKALTNFVYLKQLQHYEKEFLNFLRDEQSNIDEHKLQTIALFKKAGVQDILMPVSQSIGFGKVASFTSSIFSNFPSGKREMAEPALIMFKNAIGIYKSRILESINPLYWIDQLLFLPRNILAYIGLNSESVAFKLWNVILTFIWWSFCTLVTLFHPEIKQLIIELLGKS